MLCPGCGAFADSGLRCACQILFCAPCYDKHVCPAGDRPRWPHQKYGHDAVLAALRSGKKAICMTSPTGGGKTVTVGDIIRTVTTEMNWRVGLFTNRRVLTKQGSKTLGSMGIEHGVIAAGYPMEIMRRVQVVSAQTMHSKLARETLQLPMFDLAVFDEAHRRDFDGIHAIYQERGTPRLGVTATPLNIGDLYEDLIVAGRNRELRECGAIVPCDVFAPSEPDMKGVKMVQGEFVHKGMRQRVMQCICFADVFEAWQRHNPFQTPTMLFAPGVPESKWFAGEFEARGIRAAHIDGQTDEDERERIFDAHRDGDVKVLCSFGVLREGADLPWVDYGILVQVCGALSTYLQVVGRLLRSFPGKSRATLQEHAGAFWRHGSPNMDREWVLGKTDKDVARERRVARQRGEVREPICCPKCNGVRMAGPKCPHCGFEHQRSVRAVRMTDGTLKKMVGDVIKPKVQPNQDQRNWTSCLFAAARAGHTVAQAAGRFHKLTGRWPEGLRHLPGRESLEYNRSVAEVYPWTVKARA